MGTLPRRDDVAVPHHEVGKRSADVDCQNRRGDVFRTHYDRSTNNRENSVPVTISSTPNPNALKFSVGKDVGGPKTFAAGDDTDDVMASALLAIDGVTSIFMTADFVTLSKIPDIDWDIIAGEAQTILESHFG